MLKLVKRYEIIKRCYYERFFWQGIKIFCWRSSWIWSLWRLPFSSTAPSRLTSSVWVNLWPGSIPIWWTSRDCSASRRSRKGGEAGDYQHSLPVCEHHRAELLHADVRDLSGNQEDPRDLGVPRCAAGLHPLGRRLRDDATADVAQSELLVHGVAGGSVQYGAAVLIIHPHLIP